MRPSTCVPGTCSGCAPLGVALDRLAPLPGRTPVLWNREADVLVTPLVG